MAKQRNIVELATDQLVISTKNAHKTTDSVPQVENSIKMYGFQQPIIIDKNNNIVAGNAVYLAAKNLGYTKVPCVVLDDLSDEEIKQYKIADNKTSEFASWNEQKLKTELSYLSSPTEMQPFFDENINRMIGFSDPVLRSEPSSDDVRVVKTQIEYSDGSAPTPSVNLTGKTSEQEAKENNEFRNMLKNYEDNMAAKNAEYFSYNCGKCQRKVTITLNQ